MVQRTFGHVLIIMFENQYRGNVMHNDYMDYMRNLAAQGIELTNGFGMMPPSQIHYFPVNYVTSTKLKLTTPLIYCLPYLPKPSRTYPSFSV
jgi:hypothetical protein